MNRTLSPSEKYHLVKNVYILAETRVKQALSGPLALKALKILQKEHPFLKVCIKQKKENYEFHLQDHPPLFFKEVSEKEPEALIHDLMNQTFSFDKLFEAVLLHHPKGDVFITLLHHSIADGASAQALHQRFFEILESLMDHKDIKPKEEYPLPPALSHRIPKKYMEVEPVKAEPLKEDVHYLPGHLKDHPKKETYRLCLNLSQLITKQILKQAKSYGVSVNAYICAILSKTASLFISSSKDRYTLMHDIPINARSYLTPQASLNELASYNSGFFSSVQVSKNTTVKDMALEIFEASQKALDPLAIYEEIARNHHHCKSAPIETIPWQIQLYTSNLGVIDFHTRHLKVKHFSFHAFCHVPFLFTFCTFNSKLRFCFIFTTPYLTKKFVQQFKKSFAQEIQNELERN